MSLKPEAMSEANWNYVRWTCDVCDVLSAALSEPKEWGLNKARDKKNAIALYSEMRTLNTLLRLQAVSLAAAEDYIISAIAEAGEWLIEFGIDRALPPSIDEEN